MDCTGLKGVVYFQCLCLQHAVGCCDFHHHDVAKKVVATWPISLGWVPEG